VPELPEELRGAAYVGIDAMWAGDPAEGERATRPLRELATPLLDLSGPAPYVDVQRALDAYFPAGLMLSIDATWGDPAEDAANIEWTREFWADSHRFGAAGKTYFNFPGLREEGEAGVQASFGANHERLARIKAAYDPGNRYRANANVLPAR
jgi:hypothetical protein